MNITNNFSTSFNGSNVPVVQRVIREQMKDGSELLLKATYDKNLDTFTHLEALNIKNDRIVGGLAHIKNKGLSDEAVVTFFDKIEKNIADCVDLIGEIFAAIRS